MMDGIMSHDQLMNLAEMLDPNAPALGAGGASANRPATQKSGYSLAEAPSSSSNNNNNAITSSSSSASAEQKKTGAPANPGLVPLPPAIAHQQVAEKEGLPVPSVTREGKLLVEQQQAKVKPSGNDIWLPDEVDPSFGAGAGQKEAPPREMPDYDIVFKHNVSTEDKFLGMDFTRDGSAGTADGVVVKIKMPKQQSAKDVNLDVKEEELSLLSPYYTLKVALPMKVLPSGASATWDKRTHVLSVSVKADVSKRDYLLM